MYELPTKSERRARRPPFDIPIFNSRSTDSRTLETSRKPREFLQSLGLPERVSAQTSLKKLATVVSGEKNDSYRERATERTSRENQREGKKKRNCDTTEWATSRDRRGRNSLKHFRDSRARSLNAISSEIAVLEQIPGFRTLPVPEVSFSRLLACLYLKLIYTRLTRL